MYYSISINRIIWIVFIIHCCNCSYAQTGSLKSRENFSGLNDGVYFTFQDLKNNSPSVQQNVLFKSVYDTNFTIQSWSNTENLFYTSNNERLRVNRDSLWGFVERGTPFIFMGGRFHKMSTIGAICVFNEMYPAESSNSLVVTEMRGSVTQRIFDFETGRVGNYDIDNLVYIFLRDEELLKEFVALKNEKQKKRMMYKFLERYNEKHKFF